MYEYFYFAATPVFLLMAPKRRNAYLLHLFQKLFAASGLLNFKVTFNVAIYRAGGSLYTRLRT